ncbi:hypothetical protein SAMN05518683_107136 [Salibacterium halotolerans]|uniref:Uncharacterized protein n=1 Tax=Salibacterium halotolerans TaxID=1884432 RepID=A0A1I5RR22_9BACI|nr:hypothetical protein SAMN05518683_107136 [Salibacterium halotolerans]
MHAVYFSGPLSRFRLQILQLWTLLSKNKGVVSTNHRLVSTTPLESGISGCRRKSKDTNRRRGSLSVPKHYLRGYWVFFQAMQCPRSHSGPEQPKPDSRCAGPFSAKKQIHLQREEDTVNICESMPPLYSGGKVSVCSAYSICRRGIFLFTDF